MTDHALLALAESAARAAGRLLVDAAGSARAVVGVEGREVKVAGDRLAEQCILDHLRASGLPALSEEAGWTGAAGAPAYWVVDPLDGSVNFARGLPSCAVSIALVRDGAPVLGVVHDFRRDETFQGLVGAGAWLNGAPIHVSDTAVAAQGVVMTGIPSRMLTDAAAMARLGGFLARWRKVRMIGSAALSLAYVAAGRADAYGEENIMFWDVAAGLALVTAAGGRVEFPGDAIDLPMVVFAHNGRLG